MAGQIPIGMDTNYKLISLNLTMANRHGLITGATGTGKTVTLQKIAEQFSRHGISVFTADVKGDLAGIAFPASDNAKIKERIKKLKVKDYEPQSCPTVFWDIYGKMGHPLRTTVSEMGPLLLGRILKLNDIQQGVLNATFHVADVQGLLLLDIKDMESLLVFMKENANQFQGKYGNVTASTLGAIQRGLLTLSSSGGDKFFGEPAFNVNNLFQKDSLGKGIINILDATNLINDSLLYSTFLLWMLSELYEKLPEVGDLEKPKLVFFFDEAHLLFDSAPKALIEKIEQLIRLIRSKGVGVYFVTQTPLDVPEDVLGQLGNRVQHALRGFTPKDQKAIRAAAQTFRQNPDMDTEKEITNLAVGEALLSFLGTDGTPTIVNKASIIPPESRIGTISVNERATLINHSPFYGQYEHGVDRESAYEILNKRAQSNKEKELETVTTSTENQQPRRAPGRPKQSMTEAIIISTARTFGTQVGRQIMRGILGTLFGKK